MARQSLAGHLLGLAFRGRGNPGHTCRMKRVLGVGRTHRLGPLVEGTSRTKPGSIAAIHNAGNAAGTLKP